MSNKTTDLLGQAILPLIDETIQESMKKLDIEAKITEAVGAALSNIPSNKIEIVKAGEVIGKCEQPHKNLEELIINLGTGIPVLLQGESGTRLY